MKKAIIIAVILVIIFLVVMYIRKKRRATETVAITPITDSSQPIEHPLVTSEEIDAEMVEALG